MIERGRMGRAVAVIICALLLAFFVVRSAFVEAYQVEDPAKAAVIWPAHPDIVFAAGLADVGASAATGQPISAATIKRMKEASVDAPLAPEPFLVRGVEAQVAGDSSLALKAFLAARSRDPRSVAARFFLADHYLKTGSTHQGLAEISALTRLVPQSLNGVAPQLAAFARLPGGRQQVALLLRDQPQLEPWLLDVLATNPADANLALSLWNGRSDKDDRSWQQRLLNGLATAGRFQEARAAWARFNPAIGTDGDLIDPRFERGAMPPFGWELASGSAGVAEPTGDGSLHVLFYGRDNLALARQLLLLKPGSYRLSMRVNGAEPSAESLSWAVNCISPGRELAAVPFSLAKAGILNVDFTVPSQGCAAQQLDLIGKAPELPAQVDLAIADLRLARRGA